VVFRGVTSDGKRNRCRFSPAIEGALWKSRFNPPGAHPDDYIVTPRSDSLPISQREFEASGASQHIADLPAVRTTTRSVAFSLDGKKTFVAVRSASNVDVPIRIHEKNRADILTCDPCEFARSAFTAMASAMPEWDRGDPHTANMSR